MIRLILQGMIGAIGDHLRLRIPAQNIVLSLDEPKNISALNVLPVTIAEVSQRDGPTVAIGLQAGSDRLLAQVSARSAREMALAEGKEVFAIFKVSAATPDLRASG